MALLRACPSCSCHVHPTESECPHCGSALAGEQRARVVTAAAVLLGLSAAVVACDEPRDAYGGPGGNDVGGAGGSGAEGGTGGTGGTPASGGSSSGGSSSGGAPATGGTGGQ